MNNSRRYTRYKVIFYFMSLGLLFVLIHLLTARIPRFDSLYAAPMDWTELPCRDWVAVVSALAILLAFVCALYVWFRWRRKKSNPPYEIVEIKNENYEYLTFMTSYIMPLVCMDFNDPRYVLVFFALLFIIGFVFIRTNLYYGNPILAFMGYRLYRASIKGVNAPDGVILISRDKLDKGKKVLWIPIDEYVWVVRRTNS